MSPWNYYVVFQHTLRASSVVLNPQAQNTTKIAQKGPKSKPAEVNGGFTRGGGEKVGERSIFACKVEKK